MLQGHSRIGGMPWARDVNRETVCPECSQIGPVRLSERSAPICYSLRCGNEVRCTNEPDKGRTRVNLPIRSGGCSHGGRINGLLYPAPPYVRVATRLGGNVLAVSATSGIRIWRVEATHLTLRWGKCTCISRRLQLTSSLYEGDGSAKFRRRKTWKT